MKIEGLKRDILMLILSAVISAVVSFAVGVFQERINEQAHSESLVKQIRTTILNDLEITIPVTEGIEENLSNKQTLGSGFKILYYPMVIFPSDNISVLPSSTLSYIDEYQRRIAQCTKLREEYINMLGVSTDQKQLIGGLFAYYISLDSVVRYGINVIQDIDKHYPNLDKTLKKLPEYCSFTDFKLKIDNVCKFMSIDPRNITWSEN